MTNSNDESNPNLVLGTLWTARLVSWEFKPKSFNHSMGKSLKQITILGEEVDSRLILENATIDWKTAPAIEIIVFIDQFSVYS